MARVGKIRAKFAATEIVNTIYGKGTIRSVQKDIKIVKVDREERDIISFKYNISFEDGSVRELAENMLAEENELPPTLKDSLSKSLANSISKSSEVDESADLDKPDKSVRRAYTLNDSSLVSTSANCTITIAGSPIYSFGTVTGISFNVGSASNASNEPNALMSFEQDTVHEVYGTYEDVENIENTENIFDAPNPDYKGYGYGETIGDALSIPLKMFTIDKSLLFSPSTYTPVARQNYRWSMYDYGYHTDPKAYRPPHYAKMRSTPSLYTKDEMDATIRLLQGEQSNVSDSVSELVAQIAEEQAKLIEGDLLTKVRKVQEASMALDTSAAKNKEFLTELKESSATLLKELNHYLYQAKEGCTDAMQNFSDLGVTLSDCEKSISSFDDSLAKLQEATETTKRTGEALTSLDTTRLARVARLDRLNGTMSAKSFAELVCKEYGLDMDQELEELKKLTEKHQDSESIKVPEPKVFNLEYLESCRLAGTMIEVQERY